MKTDVLVIGGGIAGSMAALKAREMGRDVVMLKDKPGASFMHSGIFDIDTNPGRVRDISITDDTSFAENLVALNAANPNHPYSIALGGPDGEDIFSDAVSFFFNALEKAGIKTEGSLNDRLLFSNNMGTLKRARFAIKSLAAGDLRNHDSMKIAVVGISGLTEFDSKFFADSVSELLPHATGNYFQSMEAFQVELPGHGGYSNLTPFSIAQLMDESGFVDIFADIVKEKISGVFTHVAFPAVLGIEQHAEIIEKLERELGATVFEIATVQPSVPGKRISAALEKLISSAGIKLISARAGGMTAKDKKIESILVVDPHGDESEIVADYVILASGKFIGGGIIHDGELRETVLGLPIFMESGSVKKESILMDHVKRHIADRQPLLASGVAVNEQLHATGLDNKPAFENLFCAGSVIRGYDPFRDGCGTGVTVVTGYIAGRNAAALK